MEHVEAFRYLTNPIALVGFVLMLILAVHKTLINSGIIPTVTRAEGSKLLHTLLRYGFVIALLVIVLGFGVEYTKHTSQPDVVNNVVNRWESVTTVINQLQRTTVNNQTKIDFRVEVQQAAELYESGDYQEALAIYEILAEQFDKSSAVHRNIGVLRSLLGQDQEAEESFETAARIDEEHPVNPPEPVRRSILGWEPDHARDYNDSFYYATLVDPAQEVEDTLFPVGDQDYYAFATGNFAGTTIVRFRQTGPTQIQPVLKMVYGDSVAYQGQPTEGADMTVEWKLDGSGNSVYVGVSDIDDDAGAEVPYRLSFELDGEGALPPQPPALRPRISDVDVEEVEPNNDAFEATELSVGQVGAGQIREAGDVDFYQINFDGRKTGKLIVELQQLDASPLRPQLRLLDSERAARGGTSFDQPGLDLTASTEVDGRNDFYYVSVSDTKNEAATEVPYLIKAHIE